MIERDCHALPGWDYTQRYYAAQRAIVYFA